MKRILYTAPMKDTHAALADYAGGAIKTSERDGDACLDILARQDGTERTVGRITILQSGDVRLSLDAIPFHHVKTIVDALIADKVIRN